MKKLILGLVCGVALLAGDWSAPVSVLHELKPCVTYRARVEGGLLLVEATIQPGWHTFAIDNERRAAEKLAGKPSLGIDQPTKIKLAGGLEVAGPWNQSPPQDFSKPALRWFSWGFEHTALFAAKVKRIGPGPVEIGIRGQACTDKTCKNIDVSLSMPLSGETAGASSIDLKSLVPVVR